MAGLPAVQTLAPGATAPTVTTTFGDYCARCAEPINAGLCSRCAERDRSLLPLLKLPGWVRLMGLSRTEQKRLQMAKNQPSPAARRAARRKERAEQKRAQLAELRVLLARRSSPTESATA